MKAILDNDSFIKTHLAELVRKFPRRRIVICQGKIFTGDNAVKQARKEFPRAIPLSFPVPAPEEFAHLL